MCTASAGFPTIQASGVGGSSISGGSSGTSRAQDSTSPGGGGQGRRGGGPGGMGPSTLLTGASGIDNSQLKLGKTSLLGA